MLNFYEPWYQVWGMGPCFWTLPWYVLCSCFCRGRSSEIGWRGGSARMFWIDIDDGTWDVKLTRDHFLYGLFVCEWIFSVKESNVTNQHANLLAVYSYTANPLYSICINVGTGVFFCLYLLVEVLFVMCFGTYGKLCQCLDQMCHIITCLCAVYHFCHTHIV